MRLPWLSAMLHNWAKLSALMLLGWIGVSTPAALHAEPISADRKASLDHLLRHDCGSCHGMTLQGGLGPALLPEQFTDQDIDSIATMILVGNPEKAMPPWEGLLSFSDARYLARQIKNEGPN